MVAARLDFGKLKEKLGVIGSAQRKVWSLRCPAMRFASFKVGMNTVVWDRFTKNNPFLDRNGPDDSEGVKFNAHGLMASVARRESPLAG